MRRLPVGIEGFDKLVEGGIPEGFTVLVSGTTGSGKTTFLIHYIYEGLKRGERAIFITLEQTPEDILEIAEIFGMDLKKYINGGKLKMIHFRPIDLAISGDWKELIYNISSEILDFKPTRVAIDGFAVLLSMLKSEWEIRRFVMELYLSLKKYKATVLITSEIPEGEENKLSRFGVEEFIVDGIILLYFLRVGGETFGNIEIRKMRLTKHAHGQYPLYFTEKGLKVGEESTMLLK